MSAIDQDEIQMRNTTLTPPATHPSINTSNRFIQLHDMLLSESEKNADHFKVLRETAFKVAVDELELGMKLAKSNGKDKEAYKSKLQNALTHAKDQKIRCHEIMCICYLVALDDPDVAMTSILHQTEKLFEDEYISNSCLISLNKAISKHKRLDKAESRFLEDVFASVCGTIRICSERHAWKQSRDEFRKLFRSIDGIAQTYISSKIGKIFRRRNFLAF